MTTLTIARWGGGTSINAIPQEAWFEVDTRSESQESLEKLERELRDVALDESEPSVSWWSHWT